MISLNVEMGRIELPSELGAQCASTVRSQILTNEGFKHSS